MIKLCILFIFTILGTILVHAEFGRPIDVAGIESLIAIPAETRFIQADFEQYRVISGFDQPVKSSGIFWLIPGTGVVWETTAPISSLLMFTNEKIIMHNARDGTTRIPFRRMPQMAAFTGALNKLFSGSAQNIPDTFDYTLEGEKSQWTLELVPRDDKVKRLIQKISIIGGLNHVKGLRVEESSGDYTEIEFRNHRNTEALMRPDWNELLNP